MKTKLIFALCTLSLCTLFSACGGKITTPTPTSYKTLTIEKSNITVPLKYSATLKGTNDVTIKPQVSGQLMEIRITEGQQVKKGDVLFVIDSRNARLDLEYAEANLLAAQAQESSAKLEYESNKNLSHCWWGWKLGQPLWKTAWQLLTELNTVLYHPAITLPEFTQLI